MTKINTVEDVVRELEELAFPFSESIPDSKRLTAFCHETYKLRPAILALLDSIKEKTEAAKFDRRPENDTIEHGLAYHNNGLTVGQVAGENHNAALSTFISIVDEARGKSHVCKWTPEHDEEDCPEVLHAKEVDEARV